MSTPAKPKRPFFAFGNIANGTIAVGNVAFGTVAIGLSFSFGVVAIGINAVGSCVALGINAAAPIALAAVNGFGILCLAGVNGIGGTGAAGVNGGFSSYLGLVLALANGVGAIAAFLKVARTKKALLAMSRAGEPEAMPLDEARQRGEGWVRVVVSPRAEGTVHLREGSRETTAEADPAIFARVRAYEGATVLVRLSTTSRPAAEQEGYRELAIEQALGIVDVRPPAAPPERDPFVRHAVGLAIGAVVGLGCTVFALLR